MGQKVGVEMTATDASVQRVIEKQERALDKLVTKMDRLGREGQQAGRRVGGGIGGATRKVAQFVQQFAGIGGVVGGILAAAQAVRAEFDELKKREQRSRLEQGSVADVVRSTRVNILPAAEEKKLGKPLEEIIAGVSGETGANQKTIALALSDALSARGELDPNVAVDAVRQAARVNPNDEAGITALAGRALDVLKTTKETSDPRAVIGAFTEVQGASRITTVDKLGDTGVPAIAALQDFGATFQQAASLFAATTQLANDSEGRRSRTASIALGAQIRDFFPEAIGKDAQGKFAIPADQRQAFEGARGNVVNQLGVLQQSPELARAFLGQASFEKATLSAAEALVKGSERGLNALNAARNSITGLGPGQVQAFEGGVERLDAGEFEPIAQANRRRDVNRQAANLRDRSGAARDAVRRVLQETREDVDIPGFDLFEDSAEAGRFETSTDPFAAGEASLQRQIERGQQGSAFFLWQQASPEDMQRMRDALEEIRDLAADFRGGGQRVPPAAAVGNNR